MRNSFLLDTREGGIVLSLILSSPHLLSLLLLSYVGRQRCIAPVAQAKNYIRAVSKFSGVLRKSIRLALSIYLSICRAATKSTHKRIYIYISFGTSDNLTAELACG